MVTISELQSFIFDYISEYRSSYERYTSLPPEGAGYPKHDISPFLSSKEFEVYLANDGVLINEVAAEPDYQWYVAGGPALKVDYEPTKTPTEVTQIIKDHGFEGKPIGIYRIVAKEHMPNAVWRGRVKGITREVTAESLELDVTLRIKKVETSLNQLVCNFTFGAYGIVLDVHLPDQSCSFGEPYITENMGFFPADLNNRRFIRYLEIYGTSDRAA
ncbi:hypothetical protein Q8W38_18445 [Vibrio splendidus]|uniref:Uncharacterized protein n=1 Tax=Vibrio splendidus TaxID=29497 RepID=A0ABD5AEH4_VIBSP|nr:hypothetical protein [Vibrio splendidus]MDP2491337.1 hypothetical protein [Vibrio splendidus]